MRKVDHVLLAAAELAAGGNTACVFALTVAAWRRSPADFGLKHYRAEYPDHKAVTVAIQHLLGREINGTWRSPPLLERAGENRIRLTDEGWAHVHRLRAGNAEAPPRTKVVDAGCYVG